MKKYIRRMGVPKRAESILLLLLMVLSMIQPVCAEEQNQVIRVGFFAFDGYHNVDEEGHRSGYGYDFVQKMLCYNNYTAEYVGYDKNWSEMQTMLEDGEIDLLTSAQKTPEREAKFDFSEPIGTSAAILTVKSGNEKFRAQEYDTYNGMRVGVIDGNSRNERFEELAAEKGFTYSLVYYDDMATLQNDLQNSDKIDAIVTSNLRSIENEWVLDKFATSPFYAMVKKGNTELLDTVNYAIEQMNANSVGWQDELLDKYYSGGNGDSIALSSTEREYLNTLKSENKKVTVLVHPDREPYSYLVKGKPTGIIPDIFEEVAERLDLPYEYVVCENREDYAAMKKQGTVDIVLESRNDLSVAEDLGYKLTEPYMNLSYCELRRSDANGAVKTVAAINAGYTTDENTKSLLEGKEVLYYDDLQACREAVENREADASYMYDYSGQKFASEDVKGALQATTVPELGDSLTFAVANSVDYRLLAVLDKGVSSVKENYVDTAIRQNTNFSLGNLTLLQTIRRNPVILAMILLLFAIIGGMLFLSDVRKKNAVKLEIKNKKLEATEESLKEALEAANQASISKGSFLSNMSHEIRTPLNAIIGYLALAQDEDVSKEKMKHCIENCEIASRHLLQIINDVLDMSSIESGKLKIAHEEFDLKKEISDITTIFYQNATAKHIQFETHVNGLTEEWVVGDQLRLNQVLMNLLSNALKFTPENGLVNLTIEQVRNDEKKVYLRFSVADSGIGMSKEYLTKIFTPFEQENAGTAKKFGGSGLGLSITNNLVRMMGGKIAVESVQGEGTTFTVTMYFDKSQLSHEREMPLSDYAHVRVLVVDDKEDECTYIKTMLKRYGVKSDVVTSGSKAIRRIQSRLNTEYAYNLCIIDWNMPEMDGCEVTHRIREVVGDELPIIIATAYDVTALTDTAKECGVDRVIAKPLFQSTVFDLLVSTFGKYEPAPAEVQKTERIDMTGVHLLLAEDNQMNMDIAVTMLEKTGIQVDQAVNGKEAVDIFVANPEGTYDLILMDVQMPIMDGYEATKTIRMSNHPEAKSIPIIAMTANAFAEDVTEALANGMNAHIAKPINYDKLFEVLKKYAKKDCNFYER